MSNGKMSKERKHLIIEALGQRSIVLVGLMGAGKTTVGRRLAASLSLPFLDADNEIEDAAGMDIPEIFAQHGEAHFRDGERKVIVRLLDGELSVISTGGGAFMDQSTRDSLSRMAITVWLRADLEILLQRTARRNNRPLLKNDPRGTLERLINERHPTYANADITVDSRDAPHEVMVQDILIKLAEHLATPVGHPSGPSHQDTPD